MCVWKGEKTYQSPDCVIVPLIFKDLQNATGISCDTLRHFIIKAMGSGSNSIGQCSLTVESGKLQAIGTGLDVDIVFAVLRGFQDAYNVFRPTHHNDRGWEQHLARESIRRRTEVNNHPIVFLLDDFDIFSSYGKGASARITLSNNLLGRLISRYEEGNGSIDASLKAINRIVGCDVILQDFALMTEGRDLNAFGLAAVTIRDCNGNIYSGKGRDRNILIATLKAYLDAVNGYYAHYQKNRVFLF